MCIHMYLHTHLLRTRTYGPTRSLPRTHMHRHTGTSHKPAHSHKYTHSYVYALTRAERKRPRPPPHSLVLQGLHTSCYRISDHINVTPPSPTPPPPWRSIFGSLWVGRLGLCGCACVSFSVARRTHTSCHGQRFLLFVCMHVCTYRIFWRIYT